MRALLIKSILYAQMWMSAVKGQPDAMPTPAVSTSMAATGVSVTLAMLHGAKCAWVRRITLAQCCICIVLRFEAKLLG